MIVAAHQTMMGPQGGPSTLDYVQTGLVGMWDGIENAGRGVHDATASSWADLSGNGYSLTYSGYSSAKTWDADCFRFVTTVGSASTSPTFLSAATNILSGLSAVSFSICLDIGQTTDFGTPAGFRKDSNNNRLIWYRQTDGRLDPVVSTASSGTRHLDSTTPYTKDTTKEETITIDSSGNIVFYINGSQYSTSSISDFSTIAGMGSALGLNREGSKGYSSVVGTWKLMNLRLYNRALSAAEIAKNYAIDKARFNLP